MELLKIFNKRFILSAIIFAFFSVCYIDFWAPDAKGTIVSYVLFILCVCLSLFDIKKAFFIYLVLFITIIPYPRNILDVYENLQVNKDMAYNTICSLSVAGMSMIQWLSILLMFIFGVKLLIANYSFNRFYLVSLLIFVLSSIVGCIFQILITPEHFKIREIVTAIRFPLYLLEGFVAATYFINKYRLIDNVIFLLKILVFVSIVFCFRAPIFLLITISQKTPALEMGVVPHIPISMLFGILMVMNTRLKDTKLRRTMSFVAILMVFALMSPSRSQLFIFAISFFIFLILNNSFVSNTKYLFMSVGVVVLLGFAVFLSNPRFFDFLIWKVSALNLVDREVSGSEQVRRYELYNILYKLGSLPNYLIFGDGLSGFFTFRNVPLTAGIELDLKSYSSDEVRSGIIYHPHFFTNIILLKFGLIGFLIYCTWPLMLFFRAFALWKRLRRNLRGKAELIQQHAFLYYFFAIILVFFSYSFLLEMHFRGYYAVIFPYVFLLVIKIKKEISNESVISVKENIV